MMDAPDLAATVAGIVAGAAALALAVLTAATARRPASTVPNLDGYFDRWRAVHGGYDPRASSIWVRAWLTMIYRVAAPLARRGVRPDVLTAWSLQLALLVVVAAVAGGSWLMVAGWLVLCSGVVDSLDGAVAVLTDRATRWGYVLDSAADRVADVAFVGAVVIAGGSAALGAGCVVVFFLLEYVRARAANAGASEIGTVTVGERVSRVAVCAAALHAAGVVPGHRVLLATAGLGILAALSAIGLVQLVVAVRHQLAGRA